MGNLMKKMVATVIAITMVMTSGLFVFAGSPTGGDTPDKTTKPAQVTLKKTVGSVSKKQIVVKWKKVKDADYYEILVNGKTKVKKTTKTTYTLKGLKVNSRYIIQVVAHKGTEKGTASEKETMTLARRWLKSVKIKAKAKKGKATVTWKTVKGATGYQIKYKVGKTWKTKYVKGGSKTKATIKNLKKGKVTIKVRPVKKGYLGVLCKGKTVKVK